MGNELIFEGKKYISAKRASQITGYNSDYIGQLCRKGALECRLVGRSWFVEEKSLSEHEVIASKTPRGRIPSYAKKVEVVKNAVEIAKVAEFTVEQINTKNTPSTKVLDQDLEKETPISAYERNSFFSTPVEENIQDKAFIKKIATVCAAIILCVFSAPFLSGQNHASDVTRVMNSGYQIAMEINSSASKQFASAISGVKNSGLALATYSDSIHDFRIKTHKLTLSTYHIISLLPNMFFDAAHNMKTLVMSNGERKADDTEIPTPGTRSGITVVPSTGDSSKDEKLKQYIKDSFSDETQVVPDDTGTSGVIKPIFKKQSDQDYIYVIVPAKQ